MLLTEHLVRCETGGIDVFTPWYKSCIERLQQIFLQVNFISWLGGLWAGTRRVDKLCGWRTEHSAGVAVGGSSTSSLKAPVGLGQNSGSGHVSAADWWSDWSLVDSHAASVLQKENNFRILGSVLNQVTSTGGWMKVIVIENYTCASRGCGSGGIILPWAEPFPGSRCGFREKQIPWFS